MEHHTSDEFTRVVNDVLRNILGESGAKAILFYTGEPDPTTFESKLRSILGDGAEIILTELRARADSQTRSAK